VAGTLIALETVLKAAPELRERISLKYADRRMLHECCRSRPALFSRAAVRHICAPGVVALGSIDTSFLLVVGVVRSSRCHAFKRSLFAAVIGSAPAIDGTSFLAANVAMF